MTAAPPDGPPAAEGPDVSRLAPGDAVAALRSFPRRFTAVLAVVDPDDEEALHRPGPDGRSALEHADLAGRDLAVLAEAVRQVVEESEPVLHPAVADESARHYAHDATPSPTAALDLVSLEASALADRAERVPPAEWRRTAAVAGGGTLAALDVLREAVRATAAHLAAAERSRFGHPTPG